MDRIPSLHRRIKKLSNEPLLGGTIISFTKIHHPPAGFGTEPYTVALIERTNGTKVLAQLTKDSPTPQIGATVMPCMRRVRVMQNGLIVNDLKYRITAAVPESLFTIRSYVLALTGPSGVGKTTITRSLLTMFSTVTEQVPIYTTRPSKKGDSEPYVHVSAEKFEAMVERGEIVSHTQMPSASELRRYGYRKRDIEKIWKEGKLPIVVTDIHLLQGLAKAIGRESILSCGLLPPGHGRHRMLSSLLHRLRSRGRDSAEQIQERMKTAEADLQAFDDHQHLFDHLVVNDQLEQCVASIQQIVAKDE